MAESGVTATLAALAAQAGPGPAERDRARLLLADYLAVAGAGAATSSAQAAREALLTGPAGPAPVLGAGQAAAIRDAALLNGISAHSLELDDTHEPSSSHPGTVIWTALLAAAAGRPATVAAVLDSAVAGYQVMASLGELLGPAELYRQGLHPTAVCGVFGAAAAAGRLAGLDAAALGTAFGIALSLSAGSMAYLSEGAWTKRFHSGSAAAGGILAADLAAAGFTGPADAVGDRYGLMHIYGGARPPGRVAKVLAHGAALPAVHETSVKFHPCCRYMHGVMDLLAAYRTDGGRIDGIERVDCGVLTGGMGLVGEPAERKRSVANMVDAQFSMPFGAALTLSRGASSLTDFQDAGRLAPQLQPLMDKVWMYTSAELDAAYPARWGAEVTLSFADGEVVELRTTAFRGSPGWPVGRAEIAAKAAGLLGEPAATSLLATVDALGPDDTFDPARLAAAAQAGGR
ncbi:MAG TPA: MmgE/PrpD family protein [Streptosporangiaceae bacterium]